MIALRHSGLATFACAWLLTGCEAGNVNPTSPRVDFSTSVGTITYSVEVAADPSSRALGLMYRQSLAPMNGMLFVFPNEENHTFWMHNTYIALDMIFIDAGLSVVGVIANAEPMTDTPRSVNAPSKFVLEVSGGEAARQQIVVGARVTLHDVTADITQ